MIQRTLVLVKPDGVQRGLIGRILNRFEDVGMKIVGLKMKWADKELAKKHYTEEISQKYGDEVRNRLVDFISEGPVVAMVLEGVNAVENVRKMVGATEPKAATPGTIRGDFTHVSYEYAVDKVIVIKNVIHASADEKDAENEVKLWFTSEELYVYATVHEVHCR